MYKLFIISLAALSFIVPDGLCHAAENELWPPPPRIPVLKKKNDAQSDYHPAADQSMDRPSAIGGKKSDEAPESPPPAPAPAIREEDKPRHIWR